MEDATSPHRRQVNQLKEGRGVIRKWSRGYDRYVAHTCREGGGEDDDGMSE